MYVIKHKITNQYLQKWYARDKFGHWSDKPKGFTKKEKEQVQNAIGDSVEIVYKRGVK
jgi:hypothetical protein